MAKALRTEARPKAPPVLVGIDTGGTFTDLVAVVGGRLRVLKKRSTPEDPARAVLEGLKELLDGERADVLTYSSTVATNALLERKGARVAIVTNAGFEDVIEIGRQNRTELYALVPGRPEPLVPRRLRFGIAERTLADGTVERRPDRRDLERLRRRLERSGARAVAVCLLHSYANPRSEEVVAAALEPAGVPISVSSRLLPEYREVER
ncbi:MAG: hydantoinase/oxoprolinase N-terminal domain-containing protein, partial [Candidatus Binatia bacterium]